MQDVGAALSGVNVGAGPRQLEGLPHDETTEEFVEDVPGLGLAQHHILQLGVLHPDRVGRLDPGLKANKGLFLISLPYGLICKSLNS